MVALVDQSKIKTRPKMKIPHDFNIESLLKNKGDVPPPRKPRVRKSELYKDSTKFKLIDEHVEKVCQVSHRSFRGLVWHLVHNVKVIKSDLDKIRAIYRWVTTKDTVEQVFDNSAGENSAESFITDFQAGRASHAQAFQLLCLFSGFHCNIITGSAKGRNYRPGDSCNQPKFRHCWNAVYFDGNWFLVDVKWGTRNSSQFHSDISEFYFLTDPEQLQLSHWAQDPKWQLVDRPIAINEFENFPFVTTHFFKCGLNFISNVKCVIETRRGQVKWDLGLTHPAKFSYRLVSAVDKQDSMGGIPLKNFIYHEVSNGRATFALRSPSQGIYFLKIFAKPITEMNMAASRLMEVVEYKVQIDRSCIEDDPLPNCWDTTWGPGQRTEKLCLYPVQKRGLIATSEKTFCLEINKTRPVNVLCRFCRNGWKESELQKCVQIQDNDTKAYLKVTLPASGEYGLEIYGCIPNRPDTSYKHVCQYLINCQRRDDEVNDSVIERYLIPSQSKSPESAQTREDSGVTSAQECIVTEDTSNVPSSFQLTLKEEDESGLPPPSPMSEGPDADQWNDMAVDKHVEKICENQYKSFRHLLWDLVYSSKIEDELSKARALFIWLATMKMQNLIFDSVDSGSPEETLRGLQTGRTTYAIAYHTLCRYSGLTCKIITGVAKGMDYKPGQPLVPGSNHHTWNAILVNGKWYFVDTRFARRPIIGNRSSQKVQYELDAHFFMTNPKRFIYTHFPDDEKWQQLNPLVSMEQFCNMPVMTPHFFSLGLDIISHKRADIKSSGQTVIDLSYPSTKVYHFTFSVHASDGSEETDGKKFNRYAMLEASKGNVKFRLRLPQKGDFTFFIYAKEDFPDKTDNMFAQVCEYKILQEDILSPCANPYPPCAYQSWGPGVAFHQYELYTTSTSATIKTENGSASLEIASPKPMQFRTRLVQFKESQEFEGYVTHRSVELKTLFSITAPGKGEYGLEIYAKDPNAETKKMRHVAQYLIICEENIQTIQLPKLPSGFLGPQPMLMKYGVNAVSHPDPVVHLDTNFLQIDFDTSQGMRFTASLIETEVRADCSEYVFIQSDTNRISLLVTLPRKGFFTLCVHGNPLSDDSQQIPGLYNYLIHCKDVIVPVLPYPKQYGFWKEGCNMMQPLAIAPTLNTMTVPFRVKIQRATTVAVVVNKDWTPLNTSETGIWEGEVVIEANQSVTKVSLVASFGDDTTRFATLLEYSL